MAQPCISMDLVCYILLNELRDYHKLICKEVLTFITSRHPLKRWASKVSREIVKNPSILGIYTEVESPCTYILSEIKEGIAPRFLGIRLDIIARFWIKGIPKDTSLQLAQPSLVLNSEDLYQLTIWYHDISFVIKSDVCNRGVCCKGKLELLKSNLHFLIRVFKD